MDANDGDEINPTDLNPASGLISDIFGDSDEDSDFGEKTKLNHSDPVDGNDDGWSDSDDDNKIVSKNKVSRLQKHAKGKIAKKSKRPSVADIFGSDDEEDGTEKITKPIKKRKRKSDKRVNDRSGGRESDQKDSGDEYDSGDEITKTKDDDAFIDKDDELDYLVKEYDEDGQDFRDERPEQYKSSAKKSKTHEKPKVEKASDPLSQTIEAMKKPKKVAISQSDKENIVKDLLQKMTIAWTKDEECVSRGEPATHKLKLLDGVRRAVSSQELHESMVENDILSRFKEWIEPKNDSERTLPSLTVRTAVYEMLNILPCFTEHLKRSGIGITIMTLRKHKNETLPNKKLLKDLVEKWCRPLFGKSLDQRSRDVEFNDDLKIAASRQKLSSSSTEEVNTLGSIFSGDNIALKADVKARVRTPYNNGYVFTVRPESKATEKRDLLKEKLGESRMNIMKLTKIRRGGVKDNFRAIQMDGSGRDKS